MKLEKLPSPNHDDRKGAKPSFIILHYTGGRWNEVRGDATRGRSPLFLVSSFFLWTLSACFYAFLAEFLGIDTAAGFFCLSCLLWVAFSMPPTLMSALYTGYPFEAMAIDTSYQLGGYYLFAAVHIAFLEFGIL